MAIERRRPRVAVALSGGVDSAAAAAILLSQGHDVYGLTMLIDRDAGRTRETVEPAAKVAAGLGIGHEVVDLSGEFETAVVEPFVSSYLEGMTPNPCVACNNRVKFGALLGHAAAMGFDLFATGHYARVVRAGSDGRGRAGLMRAVDLDKDQSYVLWTLRAPQLESLVFPLGGLTKEEARRVAREAGLTATARESQDICFLESGGYGELIRRRAPGACGPGAIMDTSGRRIGTHRGIAHYTVGQRRGLGLGGPGAMYVLEILPGSNALVVGGPEELRCESFTVRELSFVSGETPAGPLRCSVRTRYRGPALGAVLDPLGDGAAAVRYEQSGPPAAPGQSAVFYDGDELLGGGVIAPATARGSVGAPVAGPRSRRATGAGGERHGGGHGIR